MPGTVEETRRAPSVNTGEHSAARASAVPLPDGVDGADYYAERAPDPDDGETDGGGDELVDAG